MVHAQITCGRFATAAHIPDTTDEGLTYQTRQSLDPAIAGDVLAAMCTFGLCLENLPHKDQVRAAAEVAVVSQVARRVVHNCHVAYDDIREAELYLDAGHDGEIKALVSKKGIISARFVGAGAHYTETTPDAGVDAAERLQRTVRKAQRQYCTPVDEGPNVGVDPGGAVLPPYALDHQDRLYILDQGHISVPLLRYGSSICIDYTSDAVVAGIMVIDNRYGAARPCHTRDLYSMLDIESVFKMNLHEGAPNYTRHVRHSDDASVNEPLGSEYGTRRSLEVMHNWLTGSLAEQHILFGGEHHGLSLPAVPGGDVVMDAGRALHEHAYSDGEKSLLGAPLPVQIVPEQDGLMAKTVRIAPLLTYHGADHSARVSVDSGHVDTDELADRVSRTGARNIIGIAMQKIQPNHQGDIMLHDGV